MKRIYGAGSSCTVAGCDRYPKSKGLCGAHYLRQLKTGDVGADQPLAPRRTLCTVEGCDRPARGRSLCGTHYERVRKHGTVELVPKGAAVPRLQSDGYLTIRVDGRSVLHHRYVWEHEHGPLLPGQNVHHKNGQRADNRIENLEVWDVSQPAGQRPEDRVQFAVEMLRRYAPDLLR